MFPRLLFSRVGGIDLVALTGSLPGVDWSSRTPLLVAGFPAICTPHHGAMSNPPRHSGPKGPHPFRARAHPAGFTGSPQTVRHFAEHGDPALDLLDGIVEQLIDRSAPFRALMLMGPIGSGKRALARATARELGGPVREFEPLDLVHEAQARQALHGFRDDEVVLLHNVDEFPAPILRMMIRAISNRVIVGHESAARIAFVDPSIGHVSHERAPSVEPLADVVFVLTSNFEAVPPTIAQGVISFTLRRSAAGSAAAMARALRGHGITCDPEAAAVFGQMLADACADPFVACVALVRGQSRRRGFVHVDAGLAADLVAGCWRLLGAVDVGTTIRRACARWGCSEAEAVARLRLPAELVPEVGAGRCGMVSMPHPGASGLDDDDDGG